MLWVGTIFCVFLYVWICLTIFNASEGIGSVISIAKRAFKGMAPREIASKKAVPSRQWSCSEMKDGHHKLMAIKTEAPSPEDMQKQIAETRPYLEFWCSKTMPSPNSIYLDITFREKKHIPTACSGVWASAGNFEAGLGTPRCEWILSLQVWEEGVLDCFSPIVHPFTKAIIYRRPI